MYSSVMKHFWELGVSLSGVLGWDGMGSDGMGWVCVHFLTPAGQRWSVVQVAVRKSHQRRPGMENNEVMSMIIFTGYIYFPDSSFTYLFYNGLGFDFLLPGENRQKSYAFAFCDPSLLHRRY